MTKCLNKCVFLYSSLECLMTQPCKLLMVKLINNEILKLVYVDEIHLFVRFGVTFWKELLI